MFCSPTFLSFTVFILKFFRILTDWNILIGQRCSLLWEVYFPPILNCTITIFLCLFLIDISLFLDLIRGRAKFRKNKDLTEFSFQRFMSTTNSELSREYVETPFIITSSSSCITVLGLVLKVSVNNKKIEVLWVSVSLLSLNKGLLVSRFSLENLWKKIIL